MLHRMLYDNRHEKISTKETIKAYVSRENNGTDAHCEALKLLMQLCYRNQRMRAQIWLQNYECRRLGRFHSHVLQQHTNHCQFNFIQSLKCIWCLQKEFL